MYFAAIFVSTRRPSIQEAVTTGSEVTSPVLKWEGSSVQIQLILLCKKCIWIPGVLVFKKSSEVSSDVLFFFFQDHRTVPTCRLPSWSSRRAASCTYWRSAGGRNVASPKNARKTKKPGDQVPPPRWGSPTLAESSLFSSVVSPWGASSSSANSFGSPEKSRVKKE